MPFVTTAAGLRLFYREQGSGEQALLLIHGNTASSRWWERVMAALPAGLRVVAPDLRGCGDSAKPEGGWSMADLAADIRQFMRALGLPPCIVVGHSLGGGVALQLAADHPEAVAGLVLINAAAIDGLKTPPERYAQLEAVLQRPELLKAALGAMMPAAPPDEFSRLLLEESVAQSAGALIRNGRALDGMDLTDRADQIQGPVLILYGRRDPLVSLAMMERTQAAIPGAVLEVWDEIGHSAPVEAPERLARRLAAFVGV